jgi:hypothetical protein
MKPQGLITVSGIVDSQGRPRSTQYAVEQGWIAPSLTHPTGWDLERHEVVVGFNLFTAQGHQCMAYAMGFRAPIENYVITKFGVGTGVTPPTVTDVALEAPILLDGNPTKAITAVDFAHPFTLRAQLTLGVGDANGYIISEMGLFTGSDILVARKVRAVSINKTGDFAPTLIYRLKF